MADPEAQLVKSFNLAQLKEQCSQRGLETTGKKLDLAARLNNYLFENTSDPLAAELGYTSELQEEEEVEEQNGDEDEEPGEEGEQEEMETEEAEPEEEAEEVEVKQEPDESTMETEEKKTEPQKEPTDIPAPIGRHEFKKDQNLDIRKRSVVVGPIGPEEFTRGEFETYAKETLNFFVRLNWDETNQKSWGHVEMRFKSPERAVEVVDEFPKFREDLQVRRLGMAVNAEMVDRDFKGIDVDREDPDIRTLAAYNIPTTTKDEDIRSRFPEAKSVLIAKDEDGNFQGRVYLEFSTSDDADRYLKQYCDSGYKFGERTTLYNRITTVPKSKRILDHFEHNKKGGEGQILHPNKRDSFHQRIHEFESKLREHTGNLSAAKRNHLETQVHYMKKRLAEDDELRKKKGLPQAPPPKINKSQGGQKSTRGRQNYMRGRGSYHGGPQGSFGVRNRGGPGPMHGPPQRPPPRPQGGNTTAKAMALINTLGNMLSSSMSEGSSRGFRQGGMQGPPGRYGAGRGRDDYNYGPGGGGYGGGYGGYDNSYSGNYGGYGRGAKRMRTKSGNY